MPAGWFREAAARARPCLVHIAGGRSSLATTSRVLETQRRGVRGAHTVMPGCHPWARPLEVATGTAGATRSSVPRDTRCCACQRWVKLFARNIRPLVQLGLRGGPAQWRARPVARVEDSGLLIGAERKATFQANNNYPGSMASPSQLSVHRPDSNFG